MNQTLTSNLALSQLFPDIKISPECRITETAVEATYRIYPQRSDTIDSYSIQGIGVVPIEKGSSPTSDMVSKAIDDARISAMSTLSQLLNITNSRNAVYPAPITGFDSQDNSSPPPQECGNDSDKNPRPATPSPPLEAEEDTCNPQDVEKPVPDMEPEPQETTSASGNPAPPELTVISGDKPVDNDDLTELFPEQESEGKEVDPSEPVPQKNSGTITISTGDDTPEFKKACAITIDCLGSNHQFNKHTAGEILTKAPEVIIEMVHRYGNGKYNGNKPEQIAALESLYPEALTRFKQKTGAA